jgi:hypothetical protein
MSLHQPEETHRSLLARVEPVTGRPLDSWFRALDDGPGLVRFDERVNWLRDEHELPRGFARAIVQEHDRRRAAARG